MTESCTPWHAPVVFGEIPLNFQGEWYRNGPGRFKIGHTALRPLDGDGLVVRVTFTDGSAQVQSAFVQTQDFIQDTRLQKCTSRGAFGSDSSGILLKKYLPIFKNPANTNVVVWGSNLLALWEGGAPYRLQRQSLETLGIFDEFLSFGDLFGAHPKVDNARGLLVNIGTNMVRNMLIPWQHNRLTVWELNKACKVETKYSVALRRPFAVMHDFCLTDRYLIVPQCPMGLNARGLLVGGNLATSLYPTQDGLLFYVIPRHGNKQREAFVFQGENVHVLHGINAYETRGGDVVVDVVAYTDMPHFAELMDSTYISSLGSQSFGSFTKGLRYTLPMRNKDSKGVTPISSMPLVKGGKNVSVEFPCINDRFQGKLYNYAYFLDITPIVEGNKIYPFSSLVKLDVNAGSLTKWTPLRDEQRVFLSDPVFAQNPNSQKTLEDAGLLLVSAFDASNCMSTLVLIDAPTMTTQAILDLGMGIPVGLHTAWVKADDNKHND